MKKVLGILCMALLAGVLIFSSCTKKYLITVKANNDAYGSVTGGGSYSENATATLTAIPNVDYRFVRWDDGETANPRNVTVTADATYTAIFEAFHSRTIITFNDTSWEPANVVGIDYTSQDYITFYFYKVANSQDDVFCYGFLESTTGSFDYENSGGDIMYYRDPNHLIPDDLTLLPDDPGPHWGWESFPSSFVEHITAVDLNNLTISGDWSVEVGDILTYYATDDWGATIPFTGVMENTHWTWVEASAGKDHCRP